MRVLIAEDSPVDRLAARRTIESLGHECALAKDGEEAWQQFLEFGADVILSDWLMPKLDGADLCRRVRAHPGAPYTYLILLTVLDGRDHAVAGMHAGADEYLAKPLNVDQLETCLIAAERVTRLHRGLMEQQAGRERVIARRDTLLRVARRLASYGDPDQLLGELLGAAVEMLGSQAGSIGRWDTAQQALVPSHRFGCEVSTVDDPQRLTGQAVARRELVLLSQAIAAPLVHDGRVLGGLCVAGPTDGRAFGMPDAEALDELARTGAAALAGLHRARSEGALLATRSLAADRPEANVGRAQSARHNLPPQPTPLVGRERELEAIRQLVLREDAQLVTLTGPAGVGKTRLALAAAAGLLDVFPDGVRFVDLTSVHDPSLVAPRLARSLGLSGRGAQPLAETLQVALEHAHLLLVLDNVEHLLDAGRALAEVLRACPRVRLLITSRAPLNVRWEQLFPVAPLALPEGGVDDPARLADSPAIALYVQRVRAAQPGFELTCANARAVADACVRLDGLPLAIELAAARSRVLPPGALTARLQSALSVLGGGPLDLPERHQTLRRALAWSYALLGPAEQWRFRQAGVFRGGFSLEAASALCGPARGGDDEADGELLDELGALVDKSLLCRHGQADGEPRFVMLETIREYAREQLDVAGELQDARRRHAAFYTRLAELAEAELSGPGQAAWLDRLEWDLENLRAALRWAIESADTELELRLCAALARFWLLRGYVGEGKAALAAALGRASEPSGHVRARALMGAGLLSMAADDWSSAEAHLEAAEAVWLELGFRRGQSGALSELAAVRLQRMRKPPAETRAANAGLGLLPAARVAARDALALAREVGDAPLLAAALQRSAEVAAAYGKYPEAQELLSASLATAREHGDRWRVAAVLESLVGVAVATGRPRQALVFSGLAHRLRQRLRTPLDELEHKQLERRLATARAEVGAEVAAEAWAEGHALSLDRLDVSAPAAEDSTDAQALLKASGLTAREAEVVPLVGQGLTNREISEQLGFTERTAEAHVSNILQKLELASRTQLAAWLLARHSPAAS